VSTKPQPENSALSNRISFIDVMRGIAVVSMIWMHTADGWLDRSCRASVLWRPIVAFGGLAAPLFFTLAGVGLALAWAATPTDQRATRLSSQLRRGLQLVVVGYALRLQMWMLDAGGYRRLTHWIAAASLLGAYVLAHRALRPRLAFDWRPWLAAGVLCAASLFYLQQTEPARLIGLLRVDVLQGIGLSTAVVCVICRARPALMESPLLLAALGIIVALAAGWVRQWVPGPLPVPAAGYFAAWPLPPGARSTTLFPLFPWMAYVFGGAAFAVVWSRSQTSRAGGRTLTFVTLGCAVAAFSVAEVQPWIHAFTHRWPQATDLVRVAYRLALAGALTYPAFMLARTTVGTALRQLGTASLAIYWIHLEFAFGVLAHPVSHKLDVGAWLVGFAALTVAMTALAFAINAQVGVARMKALAQTWTRALRA